MRGRREGLASAGSDCAIALRFFRRHEIPFWEMTNADELLARAPKDPPAYCLALPDRLYLVYLTGKGKPRLDLSQTAGQ